MELGVASLEESGALKEIAIVELPLPSTLEVDRSENSLAFGVCRTNACF